MLEMQGRKYGKLLRERRNWNLRRPIGKDKEKLATGGGLGLLGPEANEAPLDWSEDSQV